MALSEPGLQPQTGVISCYCLCVHALSCTLPVSCVQWCPSLCCFPLQEGVLLGAEQLPPMTHGHQSQLPPPLPR